MKPDIHPNYVEATVTCACGHSFKTRSTKADIRLDICSNCHPFFTGKQKFLDTAGRVERFQKRFAKTEETTAKKEIKQPKLAKGQVAAPKKKMKILSSAPVKTKPGAGKTSGKSEAAPKAETKK